MRIRSSAVVLVALASLVGTATSHAYVVKCQRMIAKAGSQLAQVRMKALAACHGRVVAGVTASCPDATAALAIAKATTKLGVVIGKSCGGADGVCGGDVVGEDLPQSLGWPSRCPDFERTGIDVAIDGTTCAGIATCLVSHVNAAVDQAIDLYYGDLVLPSSDVLNVCQATIGKASAAALVAQSKARQKCWDAKLNEKLGPSASCVPPAPGDFKYLAAIAKADAKQDALICKACGGPDHLCGGGDDLTPAAIGFAAACPNVTVPGGASCAGPPITDLQGLVDCVACVTEFKSACLDRVQVPELTPYPSECNACPLPAPTGPCPTALQVAFDGAGADLDVGFTGLAHDVTFPSGLGLTLGVSGCAGASQPTCGQCSLSGPSGAAQRCQDQPWVECGSTLDCTDAGAAGPCTAFFGPPQPSVFGGLPACTLNELVGAVSGTVDVDDGSTVVDMTLRSQLHVVGTAFHPCPTCDGGTCVGGARDGAACTPQGSGVFGAVSLDCPPNPAARVDGRTTPLHLTSGTQSRMLTAASPTCRQTGFTALKCFCDTCNDANADVCATNADCPLSGGNPGICGGRRCLGGGNVGAPCALASECPGATCGRPGEASQPNSCNDDTTTPGFAGCVDVGNDQGECLFGPSESRCSIQTGVPCGNDADCNPPPAGVCDDCQSGQICREHARPCFPDNGVIGSVVEVTGSAAAPCDGTSPTTLGGFFCVPPTPATLVNAAQGLPGLGRIRLPASVQFVP